MMCSIGLKSCEKKGKQERESAREVIRTAIVKQSERARERYWIIGSSDDWHLRWTTNSTRSLVTARSTHLKEFREVTVVIEFVEPVFQCAKVLHVVVRLQTRREHLHNSGGVVLKSPQKGFRLTERKGEV